MQWLQEETSLQEGGEVECHEVVRDLETLLFLKIALGAYAT